MEKAQKAHTVHIHYMAYNMLSLIWFIFMSNILQKKIKQMDIFNVKFGESDDKEKWLTISHVATSKDIAAYWVKHLV